MSINVLKEIRDLSETRENSDIYCLGLARASDKKAMEFIFRSYDNESYCFDSYKNLDLFLSNPVSDKYSSPLAPKAWLDLSICEKLNIEKRIKLLTNYHPYLMIYIEDIKNVSNKDELVEAIEGCQKFLLSNLESFCFY
jgi:hypothetical protein